MGKACTKALSGHCFRYAGALAGEFTFGSVEQDRLHLTREGGGPETIPATLVAKIQGNQATGRIPEFDTAWMAVPKDATGGVTKADWTQFMKAKYSDVLVGRQVARYDDFLSGLYDAAVAMAYPKRTTLNAHAFKYAAVVASEFYWYA